MWQWFIIPSDTMGIQWRQVGEDTYEQVIVRKDKHPGLQSCFYAFPELEEFSTKDLYQPHPTLPDHWMHVGRADDIIVFSTGEKLNPVTIEGTVMGHPKVLGAQVVGSKQFHAALMIEPAQYPKSEEEKQLFLDTIWPVIDKVNTETVAHGRISRGDIFFTDPKKPFPRAGKGTIQRAMAINLYAREIEEFFENNKDDAVMEVDLDFTSDVKLADSIRQLIQHAIKGREIGADDDFFIKGIDSLQVIQLSRELKVGLAKAGLKLSNGEIDPRAIYTHPSIRQLAAYAFSLVYTDREEYVPEETIADDEEIIFNGLVEKYTQDLPASVPNKPGPAEKGQVIIITGTTGALGSYLLDFALKSPNIMKVICFNRGFDSQHRQIEASTSRGLSTDFSRAEFLQVDLSEPDLGLTPEVKGRLLNEVDRIIHNAWPVNFNMSITSFEPHIRGVRRLVDFSVQASKSVPITFISSVGTVEKWPNLDTPVPEKALPDWSLAMFGYGQAKLAGSIILDNAAKISSVPSAIVRVGQIAGPRGKQGKWNSQEWLPSLIQSSLHLGLLPESLGTFDGMGWAPVEDIATMVLDIAGVTVNRLTEDLSGYFHVLNPKPTNWLGLIPALREFYGDRIREVVPLKEWVSALEKSQEDSVTIERNPAVKLIDTYRSAANGANMGVKAVSMDTARTESCSPTMRQMEPASPELMKHWCGQWKF